MKRCCAVHLGPIRRTEVEHVLVGECGVGELMRRMEDAAEPQPSAAQSTHDCAHVPVVRSVAANAPHVGTALGEPCPINFAACQHTIAPRREYQLRRSALDEQPRRQQPEAAQSAREEVRAFVERNGLIITRRGYLCDNHRLAPQEGLPLHTMRVMEPAVDEERLPLAPAQQRAVLANALRIAALSEKPPAVCHAKSDL